MKKHLLFLPLLALAVPAVAQHTEIIGRAGLGLMQFGGEDAPYTSQINYSSYNGSVNGYTNSPYGSRLGVGAGVGGRLQRVGQRHTLLALDLGYDWLQSRTGISTLNYYDGSSNTPRPATGTSALRSQHLTGFLALGHRFGGSAVAVDVLLGPELAFVYGFHEKGSGTYDGGTAWSTDRPGREFNRFDGRLRADATVWKAQLGFNASYSYGFINYQGGLVGGSREVYARVLRLGLAYRLR